MHLLSEETYAKIIEYVRAEAKCRKLAGTIVQELVPLVRGYAKDIGRAPIEWQELTAEGMFAVWQAIGTVDPERGKGACFTYLATNIKRKMLRYVGFQRNHLVGKNYHEARRALALTAAGEPGEYLDNAARVFRELTTRQGKRCHTLECARQILLTVEGGLTEFNETYANHSSYSPWGEEDATMYVCKLLAKAKLNDRSKDVLARRMDEEHLEDIGNDYGVSRECIRQIQNAALERLRATARSLATHPEWV